MRKIFFFVLLLLTFFLTFPVNALEIQSKNAILYNLNEDTVLFSKEPDEKVPIASLTKIMTAIVAIENISNLDEVVSIPSVALEGLAEKNAMVVGFKADERVTYRDLLYGILLPSGADATNTIAFYLSGNEENYVNLMNKKALELGLVNTYFSDTSGLDDYHNYSTVSDVAKLLKYAIQNETFKKIFTSQEYTTSNGLKLESTLTYYTEKYHLQREGEVLYTLKTKYSKEETYEIKAQNSFSMYLSKDINLKDIHFEYSGIEEITPFTPKENIGTLSVYLNDEFLNSIDIIYQGGLTFSISELLEEYHFLVLGFLFVFLVFFLLFKRNKLKHKKKKV